MGLLHKKQTREYCDLHLHILPGMDDGSPDVDTSMAMLHEQIRQGCQGLIATPHYYAQESIGDFLVRRQNAYDRFREAIARELPGWQNRIGLGAEVAYNSYLVNDPEVEKLCYNGSNYLLLEMPFRPWDKKTLRDVRIMTESLGLRVIIAHLERFPEYTSDATIEELLDMNVIIQMNAGALLHRSTKRRALKMVKNGITQILGTDSHNMDARRPNMADGLAILDKAGQSHRANELIEMGCQIYNSVMQTGGGR